MSRSLIVPTSVTSTKRRQSSLFRADNFLFDLDQVLRVQGGRLSGPPRTHSSSTSPPSCDDKSRVDRGPGTNPRVSRIHERSQTLSLTDVSGCGHPTE